MQFSTDGKDIYLTSNRAGEFLSFERINLSTKEWTTVYKNELADIEIARLSPDESKVAFVFNDKGISRLGFYDLKTGKLNSVSKLNPGVITNLEWSPDSRQVAFNLDYASEASSIYTVEPSSLQITRWAHEPNATGTDENLPLVVLRFNLANTRICSPLGNILLSDSKACAEKNAKNGEAQAKKFRPTARPEISAKNRNWIHHCFILVNERWKKCASVFKFSKSSKRVICESYARKLFL